MLIEEEISLMVSILQPKKCEQHRMIKALKWTGTIFELVELLYALYCTKRFNNGEISLTDLFAAIGEMFDFKVTNFFRIFIEIKKRTGDRIIFLYKLEKELIKYMNASDMKHMK
jgi:hypothetical protein